MDPFILNVLFIMAAIGVGLTCILLTIVLYIVADIKVSNLKHVLLWTKIDGDSVKLGTVLSEPDEYGRIHVRCRDKREYYILISDVTFIISLKDYLSYLSLVRLEKGCLNTLRFGCQKKIVFQVVIWRSYIASKCIRWLKS